MKLIDEINKSLTGFLEQQTIYEAQVKSLKSILLKKATDNTSRAYLFHIVNILTKGVQNGKLSPQGKQQAILAINPQGEILKPTSYEKKGNFYKNHKGKPFSNQKKKASAKKSFHSNAKKEVLEYFQRCNYTFKESDRGHIKFKKLKNILLEISKRDEILYEKFKAAKDFEGIMYNLPNQEKMKQLIKLHSFDLNSSKEHPLSTSSSLRTISIPMGGLNK